MAGAQDRSSSNDVTKSSGKGLPTSLTSTSSNEGTKHWAKKHRTFIASSASSMLASASLVHCSINQLLHVANAIKVPIGVGQDTHAIVGRQQMLYWNSVILLKLNVTGNLTRMPVPASKRRMRQKGSRLFGEVSSFDTLGFSYIRYRYQKLDCRMTFAFVRKMEATE